MQNDPARRFGAGMATTLVAVSILYACGSQESATDAVANGEPNSVASDVPPESEPALGEVLSSVGPADIVLPLDSFALTPAEIASIETAEDHIIAECLAARGYTYEVLPRPSAGPSNSRRYGLIDLSHASTYGYRGGPQDPATAGLLAAQEANPVPADAFDPCLEQARLELGSSVVSSDLPTVQLAAAEAWEASLTDSRTVDAVDAWVACMADAGYPDVVDPIQVIGQYTEDVRGNTPTAEEIAVAVADVSCKQETNLASIWLAVETAYQNAEIAANVATYEAIGQRAEQVVGAAIEVAATER